MRIAATRLWPERHEITGAEGKPIQVEAAERVAADLTDAQLDALLEKLHEDREGAHSRGNGSALPH
jgi:hypothetical protein